MNTKKLQSAGINSLAATAGFMAGKPVFNLVPLQNGKIKAGLMLAIGIYGAMQNDEKVQSLGLGMATYGGVRLAQEFGMAERFPNFVTQLGEVDQMAFLNGEGSVIEISPELEDFIAADEPSIESSSMAFLN